MVVALWTLRVAQCKELHWFVTAEGAESPLAKLCTRSAVGCRHSSAWPPTFQVDNVA